MAHYYMKFISARNSADKMNSVQLALEEYADNLIKMSKYKQQGLQAEVRSLASWSKTAQTYADNVCRVRMCLETAVDNYYDAERLICEHMLNTDCSFEEETLADGVELSSSGEETMTNDPELSVNLTQTGTDRIPDDRWENRYRRIRSYRQTENSRRPYMEESVVRWDNAPAGMLPWGKLFDQPDWRTLFPLIFGAVGSAGDAAGELWKLIWDFISNKADANSTVPSNLPEDCDSEENDENNTVSSEIAVGAGEIDQPKESFGAMESGVGARMGRGSAAASSMVEDYEDDDNREWEDIPVTPEKPVPEDYKSEPVFAEPLADEQFDEIDAEVFGPSYDDWSAAKAAVKPGGGIAAPLIGVASVASIATSGLGLSNELRGDKSNGNVVGKPDPPVINAKAANGVFAGNLKGKYSILAMSLSLIFSGISVTAGARINRKKRKPDDRFYVGDGVSAILSGSVIQERS